MNIQLNIYGSPLASNAASNALQFAQLCLENGHAIKRCFFYFDAVYLGLDSQAPSSDEQNLLAGWQQLAEQQVPLLLCIAAASNRGVLDKAEAERYAKPFAPMNEVFELVGLGQWAAGFRDTDKIISFK
ncbi:sulfurtransferase complex subunit TusD [Reinekea thalattae]|uniref:Sulfurtransferase complex subunit TusD n=1 Tax=Reinekea thalattae TaxID=2593301 RepID=A0A5C8Z8I5_9GAMM|nr:sulfurtransferase complex subunit TusD [Reinekea thalattae]TXR53471.1 sulfurtransferase complex subunit TusD [Reinekea thalattae]